MQTTLIHIGMFHSIIISRGGDNQHVKIDVAEADVQTQFLLELLHRQFVYFECRTWIWSFVDAENI